MLQNFTHVYTLFIGLLLSTTLFSQQLPDNHFEDWTGESFDGNAQPRYWHADNVNQSGFKFTLMTKGSGRSGACLNIQNKDCKAMGIGQSSPGYAGLGTPWQYISGIDLSSASGGMDGGISFAFRPDTLSVWIKRTGDHTTDENYNIIFYSWLGTFRSSHYKAQSGDCASISHTNEESDIRQALDANSCGTDTKGTQVAEGWVYEKKSYNQWTQLKIPIYYFSDRIPEMCNLILSAGNYPNLRGSGGIYPGNGLMVDDVELLYSSRIQKLYIDGKEWKGFDPNQPEQTYSLGRNATSIPTIEAIRGAGSLTNPSGKTAAFSGRKLQSNEISITPGQIDGTPTSITVYAEDGSSSTTYKITFVREADTNAHLNAIRVNGEDIPNFKAGILSYDIALPYGTTQTPVVSVEKQSEEQTVQITQASSVTGACTIQVTAADKKTTLTYTIRFSVAPLSDNTLQDIKVNGHSISGFNPGQTIYKVSLPTTTTIMPTVEAVSAYPQGAQTITHTPPTVIDGGQYLIAVSTPGNPTPKTYKLTFRLEASDYAYLQSIAINGTPIPDFQPATFNYSITLPIGTSSMPSITWVKGEEGQTVELSAGGIDGTSRITVTAANGNQVTYKITLSTIKSEISTLKNIFIGGKPLDGFSPTQTQYTYSLPIGTTELPTITVEQGDTYQTVTISKGPLNGTTRIIVTAGNGNTTVYQILFSVQQASDNTLQMIYLNGIPLAGFQPNQNEYDCPLPKGTTALPAVTYDAHDSYQVISTRSGGLNGDYKITVRPQTGSARTYILHFHVESSSNTALQMIYLDGKSLPNFHPDTLCYTDTLPEGVSTYPAIRWDKAEESQRVLCVQENDRFILTVTAENGAKRTYTILFIVQKSENAFLQMIYLNGQDLPDFQPEQLSYSVSIPNTDSCPLISVNKAFGQQITIISPISTGEALIRVQPEQGAANTYRITFFHEQNKTFASSPNTDEMDTTTHLSAILLDGLPIDHWQPTQTQYNIALPAGSTLPTVQYALGHPAQSVLCGWTDATRFQLLVRSQRGDTLNYTLHFHIAPLDDARLVNIRVDGQEINFFPDQHLYTLPLDEGVSLPDILITTRPGQTTMETIENDSTQLVAVLAQSGKTSFYRIQYHRVLSSNALLQTILLNGDTLPGFRPDQLTYTDTLPWRSKVVPVIMAIGQRSNQTITTYHSAVNGVSRIRVQAANGEASTDYTIAFPVVKSSNTQLKDLYLSNEDISLPFHPDKTDYTIAIPYQSSSIPHIMYEKAEPEQTIRVDSAALWDTTRITVTAENGVTRQYRIVFRPTLSSRTNRLQSLTILETGQKIHPDSLQTTVSLPYGTQNLTIDYTKKYDEQTVIVQPGGVHNATTIVVRSNRTDEEDIVYTLTPQLNTQNPAVLSDLTVNDVTIANFDPNCFSYIIGVDETPIIRYQADTDVQVSVHVQSGKHWQASVTSHGYSNTYDIWYYYPHHVIPNTDFTEWTKAAYNNADKPIGWAVVADAAEKYLGNTTGTECNNTNNTIARLRSVYKGYCCRSTPGVITLGNISGELNTSNNFTVTGSIAFHNSPDQLLVHYNAPSIKNHNRIVYQLWGSNGYYVLEHQDTEAFSDYRTLTIALDSINLSAGDPIGMNIILNSYYCEQGGLGSEGMSTTSEMNVDWIKAVYNSTLTSLRVNGISASQSGNRFTATLTDSENTLLPQLRFTGQVADQAQRVVWQSPSTQGSFAVRQASITNYAEDGSSTAYTLTVKRPLSAIDTLQNIYINSQPLSSFDALRDTYTITLPRFDASLPDIYPIPASHLQKVQISPSDDTIHISIQSEIGTSRTITIHFVRPAAPLVSVTSITQEIPDTTSHTTTGLLSEIELDGNIPADFSSTTFAYTKPRPTTTSFVRENPMDSVVYIQSPTQMIWQVYGSEHHTYTITYPTALSSNTHLQSVWVNQHLLSGWDANINEYTIPSDTAIHLEVLLRENAQSILLTIDSITRTFLLQISAPDGTIGTPYSFQITPQTSSDASLAQVLLDSVPLFSFHPDTLHYRIVLPTEKVKIFEPQIPSIRFLPSDNHAHVEFNAGGLDETTYIHVTARDGYTTRQYELDFSAEPSHNADLIGISVDGEWLDHFESGRHYYSASTTRPFPSIQWKAQDRFQTVTLTNEGNIYTLLVTAQDGITSQTYTIEVYHQQASSDATLANLLINNMPMNSFETGLNPSLQFYPMQNHYSIHLPSGSSMIPDIHAFLSTDGQSAQTGSMEDTLWIDILAADSITFNRYSLSFDTPLSENTSLSMLYIDGNAIEHFDAHRYIYDVTLPVGYHQWPEVVGQASESAQQVSDATIDTLTQRALITVTAQDGVHTARYVVQFHFTRSAVDTLQMIFEDGITLPNFDSHTYYYSRTLPIGTQHWPQIEWEQGDEWQTICLDTVLTSTHEALFRLHVTAENGNRNHYLLSYTIALSTVDTLQTISINSRPLPDFSAYQMQYSCVVDTLPIVTWEKGDPYQSDTLLWVEDFTTAHSLGTKAEIHITAQNGNQRVYTLLFTSPLSSDANLSMIYVGGEKLPNYQEDTYLYKVSIPANMPIPSVTWDQKAFQSVVRDSIDTNKITLTVTAEDGTQQQYRIIFEPRLSSNTRLQSILLNGTPMEEFESGTYEYSITLPYGTTSLPHIEVIGQEEKQQLEIASPILLSNGEHKVTITVTAANREDVAEYTLIFIIAKNSDAHLLHLSVREQDVPHFHPDTTDYTILYPVGTTREEWAHWQDVRFTLSDSLATATVEEAQDGTLTIVVTAQDGSSLCYFIRQQTQLSANASLSHIRIDGKELYGFSPTVFEYTYYVGTSQPSVEAIAEDSLAFVEYSRYVDGEDFYIYVTAPDGSSQTYTIHFPATTISSSLMPQQQDVVMFHHPGSLQVHFASLRSNVSVAIYNERGQRLALIPVPESDQNDAVIYTNPQGQTTLLSVRTPLATFILPQSHHMYIYTFLYNASSIIQTGKIILTQ